ncbi:MAG: hypothetical protein ACOCRX_11210 [Candidatus Woesearchaeota archaeon]
MSYISNPINITPSDFAEYCYCGIKWAFSKGEWKNVYFEQSAHLSDSQIEKIENRKQLNVGQKNEKLCINYVINSASTFDESEIIFDGTTAEKKLLKTNLVIDNKRILAKPDLILELHKSNSIYNVLFEFKAVKKKEYLKLDVFDSILAQLWCYTYLVDIKIDAYFLLRYHKNPLEKNNVKSQRFTKEDLNNKGFDSLFGQYVQAIKKLEEANSIDPSVDSSSFNPPVKEEDIKRKCKNCSYNFICIRNGWKWKEKSWQDYIY